MGRHRGDSDKRTYTITQLNERHLEILRLMSLGMSHKAIADELNVTAQTVSNTICNKLGQGEMAQLTNARNAETIALGRRLTHIAIKAVETLESKLDDETVPASVQVNAALGVLNRTLPNKVEVENKHTHTLSKETLEEIKKRAIANGVISQEAVPTSTKEIAYAERTPGGNNGKADQGSVESD